MTTRTAPRRMTAMMVAGLLMSGCSSSDPGRPDQGATTTSAASRSVEQMEWTKCGPIECGTVQVLAAPEDPSSPMATLKVFRRRPSTPDGHKTLVLLPDRGYGYDARQLTELAPVILGASVGRFEIVSMEPRGWPGVSVPGGFAHRAASLDIVDDLEVLRSRLGVDRVSVLAWGRGATVGATWKMMNPGSIDAMVLDTPWDPSVSTRRQGIDQITSSISVERAAVRWCASHLSCPLNANTTTDLRKILKHFRDGRLDPRLTPELLARAATRSLAAGDPRTLFVGIVDAEQGDASTLIELAGQSPNVDDAQSACADVSAGSAAAIASAFSKMTKSRRILFHIGIEGPLYAMCADLPPSQRPLGTVRAVEGATGSKVMTVIARSDPTWPEGSVKNMSSRMQWSHRTVTSSRHLVIGFDRAATVEAVDFLTS